MVGPTQPSYAQLSRWRHPCVPLGTVLGSCLAGVAVAWLLVANRVPSLEPFTFERNLITGVLTVLLMFLPVCLFLRSPARIFLAGIITCAIPALTYRVMEIPFPRLATRLGAFHLFMLGAVVFGLLAALDWVALMIFAVWRNPAVVSRR
jgi:hypothetical protein